MALSGLHTNYTQGSYKQDRGFILKVAENNSLRLDGQTGLSPHFDGKDSIAIGYGLDLLVNDNIKLEIYLKDPSVGLNLSNKDKELLSSARNSRNNILVKINTIQKQINNKQIPYSQGISQIAQLKLQLKGVLQSTVSKLSLSLPNETTASNLLDLVADEKQKYLQDYLKSIPGISGDHRLTESRELAVLVSMWYQTPAYFQKKV